MHVIRRRLRIAWRAFAALCWLAGGSFAGQALAAPNVVLIVIDDLGASDLGCYGSRFHRTPHLDRMAAAGMRFTAAYAACPVCSPTRAALLTGKYPARLRLTDWLPGQEDQPEHRLLRPLFRQELPLAEVTIADRLKSAGYICGSIGKWHLGGEGYEPTRQGFDISIAGDQAGSPPTYFAPYAKNGRAIPDLEDAPEGEYLADRLTAEAERFLEQQAKRPFFLYLPHYAVHRPLAGKPDVTAKYADAPPHGQQRNPIYAAMLESVDDSVGRILAKLDELKIADNTLVIFTSDNGGFATTDGQGLPATSNAPLREGKGYLYEGGIRVPLLARWPGVIPAGSECATPVSSVDWFPTLSEICRPTADGAGKPQVDRPHVDGASLAGLLRQSGELAPRDLFWHYPHYSNQGGKPGGAIRRGNLKLIEFYEQGRRELFDLQKDPSENVNLAEQLPEQTAALGDALTAWRTAVDAQNMTPNPNYAPNPQNAKGIVVLRADTADVHGVMLRYEPLPHKNTLGFWVRAEDWASWEFEIRQPGTFELMALQGCGPGSGGSEVDFEVAGQTVALTVVETRGFQDFIERPVGTIRIDRPGRYTLNVRPRTKPKAAVMDLREVRLAPKS